MWTGRIKNFASRRLDVYANRKNLKRIKGSLRDNDQIMRMKAIDGLYALAVRWNKEDPVSYRRACAAFVLSLKDPQIDVRLRCVERLRSLAAHPEFSEPGLLLLALRDPSAPVRELAARACLDSNNLPLVIEALKSTDAEVRAILAAGLGEEIYARLQRVNLYDRWSRGLPSVHGKIPGSDSIEDRALYLRDKAMEREMLQQISKSVIRFLKRSGEITLAETIFAKALRIYNSTDKRRAPLTNLLFALLNEDSSAAEQAERLLVDGDLEVLRPRADAEDAPFAGVSPRCDSCNKELEALDLSGVAESLLSPSLALFDGVVCRSCRKIECSACKSHRREDICKWCNHRVVMAHSRLL